MKKARGRQNEMPEEPEFFDKILPITKVKTFLAYIQSLRFSAYSLCFEKVLVRSFKESTHVFIFIGIAYKKVLFRVCCGI